MFLIWHTMSHDHMVRGLHDFIGAHKSLRDTMLVICHVTSCDHMIRWPCNPMSGFPLSIGEVTSLRAMSVSVENT